MVTFYDINADGSAGKPVLFLDSLKVSTIEQTAETSEARGGKANPVLISWDYGKEINITIEDALFSPKSMNIMFGSANASLTPVTSTIMKTAVGRLDNAGKLPTGMDIEVYDSVSQTFKKKKLNFAASTAGAGYEATFADALGSATGVGLVGVWLEDGRQLLSGTTAITTTNTTGNLWSEFNTTTDADVATGDPAGYNAVLAGKKFFIKYNLPVMKSVITIDGNSFPGTYYVTGDTYARSDIDGKDHYFQFIVKKAKMQAENTITLEAEGDPSTFNMSLKVLRPDDGKMMELVQYDLVAPIV